MSSKLRESLEKLNAVDLSWLEFPLDGDSSTIYNSNKKEITIPYWRVAELLNGVKEAQDMAKAALSDPPRNCDIGTADEQDERFDRWCDRKNIKDCWGIGCRKYLIAWSQMPYKEGGAIEN